MQSKALICLTAALLTAPLLLSPPALGAREESGSGAVFCMCEEEIFSAFSDTVFFGESTTAHLARTGGLFDTPRLRTLVWRDASGTRMLDRRLLMSSLHFAYRDGSTATLTVAEALAQIKPARIVLSFGLNGIRTHAKDIARFLSTYRAFLDGIRTHSPDTEVFLQSVYPVGVNSAFSEDCAVINREISLLNSALAAAAAEWGDVTFLDTAPLLCASDGSLAPEFDLGDGIHLTDAAYEKILAYLASRL